MPFMSDYFHNSSTLVPKWFFGALICTVGAILTALGMTLQSYSHVLARRAVDSKGLAYFMQPWWQLGLLVFLIGQVSNVVAMSLAPQAMLSCLGALSLIFNAIFAYSILQEKQCFWEKVAMGGMIAGVLLVVCSTPADLEPLRLDVDGDGTPGEPLLQPIFLLLTIGLTALLLVLRLLAVYAGVGLSFVPVYWALVTAVKRGFAVVLFRCASPFLFSAPASPAGTSSGVWLLVALALLLCVSQTHTLNLGIAEGNAMVVLPVFYAFSILAQILMAGLAFGELSRFQGPTEAATFCLGVFLVIACIALSLRARLLGLSSVPDATGADAKEDDLLDAEAAASAAVLAAAEATPLLVSSWTLPTGSSSWTQSKASLGLKPGFQNYGYGRSGGYGYPAYYGYGASTTTPWSLSFALLHMGLDSPGSSGGRFLAGPLGIV